MRSGVLRIGAPTLLAIVVVGMIVATCDSAGRGGSAGRIRGRADEPGSDGRADGDDGTRDRHPGRDTVVLGRPGVDRQRRRIVATPPASAGHPRRRWRPTAAIPRSASSARTPGSTADPTARGCPGPRSRWARASR